MAQLADPRTFTPTDTVNAGILSDHLASASVTANADGTWNSTIQYTAFGEVRASKGVTATQYRYTGQLAQDSVGLDYYVARWYDPVIGHFTSADTIIINNKNGNEINRYSYGFYNPIVFSDPNGHRPCEPTSEDCDWKIVYFQEKAYDIFQKLAGVNDLEALAEIVETADRVYSSYEEILPKVSDFFLGVSIYGPSTLAVAAFEGIAQGGCIGVGREPHDCEKNKKYFADTGFHPDFRDGHNQPYHVWGYIANASTPQTNYWKELNRDVSIIGNIVHDYIQGKLGIDGGWGVSWNDYVLSEAGMEIGAMITNGTLPTNELADTMRKNFGMDGPGSSGRLQSIQSTTGIIPPLFP